MKNCLILLNRIKMLNKASKFSSIILVLIFAVGFFAPAGSVFAETRVSFYMASWMSFSLNDSPTQLLAFTIKDDGGGSITPAAGVAVMLPKDVDILWDKTVKQLTVDGVLTDVSYSKDLKTLNIPVGKTFAAGDSTVVTGQIVRVYDKGASYRNLYLDVNGDGVSDATCTNGFVIDETVLRTDRTPPFAVTGLSYTKTADSVLVSWENPVDPDFLKTVLVRTLTRNGTISTSEYEINKTDTSFSDNSLMKGDSIEYALSTKDYNSNTALPEKITVQIQQEEAVLPPPAQEESPQNAGTTTPVDIEPAVKSILDNISQDDVNALARFSDVGTGTPNLEEIAYAIKNNFVKPGKNKKLGLLNKITYSQFATISGRAFNINASGGYFARFKKLNYIKRSIKASQKITRKNALKILFKINGINETNQQIENIAKLKGYLIQRDLIVWIVKILELTQ